MTQATHTQALCAPRPQARLTTRLRAALSWIANHRIGTDPEPENLAGFSTKYRAELAEHKHRQQSLIVHVMACAGWNDPKYPGAHSR